MRAFWPAVEAGLHTVRLCNLQARFRVDSDVPRRIEPAEARSEPE